MGIKSKAELYCDKIIEIFLYILIFCLPFSKAMIEISATFIILAWIIKKVFSRRLVSTYLNIPIAVYILAIFLSVLFSSNFALSLKNFTTKTMEYIFLFFIVAEFIRDKRKLKNTIIVILVSAAMVGADSLFQYFFGFDFLRLRYLQSGRITASFHMPGDLAGYLAPVLFLPLSLCFLRLKGRVRLSLMIESILLLGLLIVSLARGAWMGFAAGIIFLGIMENKKILYITLTFLIFLSIAMPYLLETPEDIFTRLKSIFVVSDSSSLDRKVIWQAALQMIKERPVFGQGLSTFMGNFTRFSKDYYYLDKGIIPYAHNCYLQIAAETGIVGFLSFLTLLGVFFIHTIRSLAKIKDKFYHAILASISAGIIATLVHSAVDTNLYSLQLSILFWIMLGLNAGLQPKIGLEKCLK
ncbi:MAG: O-antigen ligase family protein [Candidatus Omnitrophota bacterium]|nr:MAG: O-antigen ligase family protein [Candidatus Omnitrophota bacterium]